MTIPGPTTLSSTGDPAVTTSSMINGGVSIYIYMHAKCTIMQYDVV